MLLKRLQKLITTCAAWLLFITKKKPKNAILMKKLEKKLLKTVKRLVQLWAEKPAELRVTCTVGN